MNKLNLLLSVEQAKLVARALEIYSIDTDDRQYDFYKGDGGREDRKRMRGIVLHRLWREISLTENTLKKDSEEDENTRKLRESMEKNGEFDCIKEKDE